MLQFSRYTLIWPLKNDNRKLILYNTFSNSIVITNKNIINKIDDCKNLDEGDFSDDIKKLLDNHILTLNKELENQEVINFKKRFKSNLDVLNIQIITTDRCNMSCSYCIRGINKGSGYLTENNAINIINWAKHIKDYRGYSKLNISFTGGEPLLNDNIIYFICNEIKKLKLNCDFSLQTNGTLLTKEKIIKLNINKIKTYIISLDGPAIIHNNRRKLLTSDNDSFSVIVNNLRNIPKDSNIFINIKIDKDNISYILPLLKELKSLNLLRPVNITLGFIIKGHNNKNNCNDFIIDYPKMRHEYLELWKSLLQEGFSFQSALKAGLCLYKSNNFFIIDSIGDIYKCPASIGLNEFYIGNVTNIDIEKLMDEGNRDKIKENYSNKCNNCIYLPLCDEGCNYQKVLDLYDDKLLCKNQKLFFDDMFLILKNIIEKKYDRKKQSLY